MKKEPQESPINTALDNPLRQSRKCTSVLAKLYWLIVASYNPSISEWTRGISRYTKDVRNVPHQTAAKRTEKRTNLQNSITDENPSWLQIIRGFKVLDIRRFRVTIETWRGDDEDYAITRLDSEPYVEEESEYGGEDGSEG